MPRRKPVASQTGEQVELLQAKLEVSELRHQLQELKRVIGQYQQELRECSKLLLKQRLPPRPFTNSTEKQLIAAAQGWKCSSGDPKCPLLVLTGGYFDQSLYIIDHTTPWAASGKHWNNRRAICVWCDAVKTRREIAERKHRPPSDDGESDADE
jgi:hypothetical protein